jgi:hypothetical protein
MAEEQDNVTPEEKLLNVIQSGGEEEASPEEKLAQAAAAPAAEQPAEEVPAKEETAPDEAKPALKVAKTEEPAAQEGEAKEEPKEAPGEAPAPAAAPAAEASVAGFSKKKAGSSSGIKIINRMLAASILVLLGLCGFETFMTIKARGSVKEPGQLQIPEAQVVELSIDEVRSAYTGDIWWRLESITGAGNGTTTQTKTVTVSTTPWQQAMKGHFKLLATSMKDPKSESKAILVDSRDNKMYFVRLGNSFMVEGTQVKLDDLEADRARFAVGGTSIELK